MRSDGKLFDWRAIGANPQTTWSGAIGGVCTILLALKMSIDSDAGFDFWTFVQSDGVVTAGLGLAAGLAIIVNGMFSRDANKSSQDSGLRAPVDESVIEAKVEVAVDEALGRK